MRAFRLLSGLDAVFSAISDYALELSIGRYSLRYTVAATSASSCFSDIPTIVSATCYAHTKPPSSLSCTWSPPAEQKTYLIFTGEFFVGKPVSPACESCGSGQQ